MARRDGTWAEDERQDTVFEQRDFMLEYLGTSELRMSPTAHALLWFLLFNMRKPDPADPWAYHVNIYKTKMSVLRAATGRSENAVRAGLKELEDNGFIYATPRIRQDGSTTNPDIEMLNPGAPSENRGEPSKTEGRGTPKTEGHNKEMNSK